MASMFLPSLLAHYKLPSDINCTNLEASDHFFDAIVSSELITDVHVELYSFYVSSHFSLVPRRWEVWDSGITSLQNPVS